MDEITSAIAGLTRRVHAYRVFEINKGNMMPLEIKGLKGKALTARANIDKLNAAYDKFNEAAPKHVSDVEGLAAQVDGMQDDLEFAASVLGNSTERSGESENLKEVAETASTTFPRDPV